MIREIILQFHASETDIDRNEVGVEDLLEEFLDGVGYLAGDTTIDEDVMEREYGGEDA